MAKKLPALRIAFAAQAYGPGTNGAGVFVMHLAEGLARAGHQVLVLLPSKHIRAYSAADNGVLLRGITALPLIPFYPDVYVTPLPAAQAARALNEFKPTLVHLHDHYPLSRGVLRAALQRGLPVLGTNHFLPENLSPYIPSPACCRGMVDRILWQTVLSVFNRVHLATAPTRTAAEILRRQQIRIPVQAISCGVDPDRFHPDAGVNRAEMRARYGIDQERVIFLYVGRVDPEKRLDLLIQAFHGLHRDDWQLVIAGRGRHQKALQQLKEHLELADHVRFTGYVPEEDLPALLNSVEIFAMPSEAELQSIATLEAMSTGLPILAADARALPELVNNGVNGYLFRAGDAADAARRIVQLLDGREHWGRMGAASRAIAARHHLDNTIRLYERLYGALCASRPREAFLPETRAKGLT